MMKHPEIVAIRTENEYYKTNVDNVEEIIYSHNGPFMWAGPAFRVAMQHPGGDAKRLDIWVPLAAVIEIKAFRP